LISHNVPVKNGYEENKGRVRWSKRRGRTKVL